MGRKVSGETPKIEAPSLKASGAHRPDENNVVVLKKSNPSFLKTSMLLCRVRQNLDKRIVDEDKTCSDCVYFNAPSRERPYLARCSSSDWDRVKLPADEPCEYFMDKRLGKVFEEINTVELHPAVDFHPEVGLILGLSLESKKEKLILGLETWKEDQTRLQGNLSQFPQKIRLKETRNLRSSRKYVVDFLEAFITLQKDGETQKETRNELFQELVKKIAYYWWHQDERWYITVACWVIGTYCYPMFTHFPILHLQGERESGKTTLENLLYELVRDPTPRGIAMREAPLFRTIEALRPTILADVQNVSSRPDLVDICECCTEPGSSVRRCIGETHRVVDFDVFTPVCLATREDTPFEPKCIRIITTRPPSDIHRLYTKRRLWIRNDPELRELRKSIILTVLRDWEFIYEAYNEVEQTEKLYGRVFDYWRPLLAICKAFDPSRYEQLLGLAEEYALMNSIGDLMVEVENAVLRVLADNPSGSIYLKTLTEMVDNEIPGIRISWQRVKSALANLGVVKTTRSRRDGLVIYLDMDRVKSKAKELGESD